MPTLDQAVHDAKLVRWSVVIACYALFVSPVHADPLPYVSFSNSFYTVNEVDGTVTLTLTLSASSVNPVTVSYATQDGSAVAGQDYAAASGTITFAPGQTSKNLAVTILDDGLAEDTESFAVELSNPTGAVVSGMPATVQIQDDDSARLVSFSTYNSTVDEPAGSVTLSLTLSSPSMNPVTVSYATQDGSAVAGQDYVAASGTVTFAAGQTTLTLPAISILDDGVPENTESFSVQLSGIVGASPYSMPATVTIQDDDSAQGMQPTVSFSTSNPEANEGDGSVTLTLTLSSPSMDMVTVSYATADGTATALGDQPDYTAASGTVTFAAGQMSVDLPPITINDDYIYEGDENFTVTLSNPMGANLAVAQATVTIKDDDSEPTVRFDAGTYRANEDSGVASIDVILTGESAFPVTVGYGSSDGTATSTGASADYVAVPPGSNLTFAPGETRKTFTVEVVNDGIAEGDEAFNVSLYGPVGAALGDTATAVVTISDNSSEIDVMATASDFTPNVTYVGEEVTAILSATVETDLGDLYPDLMGPVWMRPSDGTPPSAWKIDVSYHATDPTALQPAVTGSYSYLVEQSSIPTSPDATLRFTPLVEGYWQVTVRPYVSYSSGTTVFANEAVAILTLLQVGAARAAAAGDLDAPLIASRPPAGSKSLGYDWKEQVGDVEVLRTWQTRYTAPKAGAVDKWRYKKGGGAWTDLSGTTNPAAFTETSVGVFQIQYIRGGVASASRTLIVGDVTTPAGSAGIDIKAVGKYVKAPLRNAGFGYDNPGIAMVMKGRVDPVAGSPTTSKFKWGVRGGYLSESRLYP